MRSAFLLLAVMSSQVAPTQTLVIPPGTATTPGNSYSVYPWVPAGTVAGVRYMTLYDGSNFQSLGSPIRITRIRWRADDYGFSWSGGRYASVGVSLSTAPIDHRAATTNFATNHGANVTLCYRGPVSIARGQGSGAGVVGVPVVDIALQTPFLYEPALGDLVVDVDLLGGSYYSGGSLPRVDSQTGTSATSIFTAAGYPAAAGIQSNAPVLLLDYEPANGLVANFTASPVSGSSPLLVQFTDESRSSHPGGATSWAWDFDGDGLVDSTAQNPAHTYTSCGIYDVSLTVSDGVHLPRTLVSPGLITVDPIRPSFTAALLTPPAIQFTDTTTPAASAWAWDFDDDGVIDSTLQNPVWRAPNACVTTTTKLTVTSLCQTATVTRSVFLAPNPAVLGAMGGGNSVLSLTHTGNLFDVQVTAPDGIRVCGLVITPNLINVPVNVLVYLTEETHVGKETDPSAWRLVSTGSGIASGGGATSPQPIDIPVDAYHLPMGSYGMAVFVENPSGPMLLAYSSGMAASPYVHPDLTIHPRGVGVVQDSLFGGTSSPGLWNGGFYFTRCNQTHEAAYGFFGTGCPGSMGVARLRATALPRIGSTLSVEIDNLPNGSALMILGLNTSNSPFGPLPLDLSPSGAPGCMLRVRPDATYLLSGAGNRVSWSVPVPNRPALLCMPIYNQALVVDSVFNGLGGVMSDAAGGTLGN